MLFLKAIVIFMGVLILAGVVTIGVLLAKRASKYITTKEAPVVAEVVTPTSIDSSGALPAFGSVSLDLPRGSRIQTITTAGRRLILTVRGPNGAERIVLIDLRTGETLGSVALEAP